MGVGGGGVMEIEGEIDKLQRNRRSWCRGEQSFRHENYFVKRKMIRLQISLNKISSAVLYQ